MLILLIVPSLVAGRRPWVSEMNLSRPDLNCKVTLDPTKLPLVAGNSSAWFKTGWEMNKLGLVSDAERGADNSC